MEPGGDWGERYRWLFSSERGAAGHLLPRWLLLRALGLIYFSAFFPLLFQIRGLIGPEGILPTAPYLEAVARSFGPIGRVWFAPTLLWIASGPHMLLTLCWIGMAAALLAFANCWPRLTLFVCWLCFLSFVTAAQDFSSYQSDGMLLEAGFLALFFAPPGLWPGLGRLHPPSRASLFLLQWEWFRIYFESGMVKLLSGDPEWRHLTAMDHYYQNGPLPTWIGWYVQHLPHWFQASTALATLVLELGLVCMLFFPRRVRIVCFFIVTPWEIAVILTANYAFLNYLVLSLGLLLLDDRFLRWALPARWLRLLPSLAEGPQAAVAPPRSHLQALWRSIRFGAASAMLAWIFYVTAAEMLALVVRPSPLPDGPVAALAPFRIANQYGLFAVMTRGRYEIEFQGSRDGQTWIAYPYRHKPQALDKPPGIYAPYQPRFEWNLWFASLGPWEQYPLVPRTEERLLGNDPAVLSLFAANPFPGNPPTRVRAVLWQYWFTSMAEKRATGNWWRRRLLGLYAPTLERMPNGYVRITALPGDLPRHS